ncbi:MAG: hypothetical protein JWP44_2900 [Mucilaginibacter sp.]|nr:hypothetical protein [Mucilaginibacter sp.]
MNGVLKYLIFFISATVITGCKKPYSPPAINSPGSYLVVEGVISPGTELTTIKLSRTVKISNNAIAPESGATMTIEGDQNETYPMVPNGAGVYTCTVGSGISKKYRLKIATADGQQYLSNFEVAQNTPPIDSIGYKLTQNGLQIYVNTHDPRNSTHYYRWDYGETWQFHAKYFSQFEIKDNQLLVRAKQIYGCFGSDSSSNIVLGSSASLQQDVIYQQPITDILATSEKLETKYSILVREYALTGEAFNFWTNLRKNTEQLGSIFDAQPSTINGNIHCISNPALPVLGYISVSSTQSKRIFITNLQLPNNFFPTYPYNCAEDTVKWVDLPSILTVAPGIIDVTTQASKNGFVIGYLVTTPICADCTLRGTTTQPYFWK